MSKDLGKSTSYAYYVEAGGTKTPQEYGEMLVNIDTVATRAEDAADSAAESATGALNSKNAAQTAATTATNKASEATTAAQTATTKAGEASQSASQASTSATTASTKASEASQSASTASAKATEATTAAGTATTAKNDAVAAKTAAQTAQTAAETAQGKAETAQETAEDAAESVSASAAQIATNTADISDIKENLDDLLLSVDAETFTGKLVRVTGLQAYTGFNAYKVTIPQNVTKLKVKTNFFGNVYIVFSDQEEDAVFNNFPYAQYPQSGYANPTTITEVIETHGFKYAYIPLYLASGVIFSCKYSEFEIIENKVDKNGTKQIGENNTTFFTKVYSNNIVNVPNEVITESPLTFTAEDNHFVTTIGTALESRVMPIFHEMLLKAGTYTFTVFADEEYHTYSGGAYIGLYTGENKNNLYQYAYVSYIDGTSKTFTLDDDTVVYFRFRTQDLTELNEIYSDLGNIGFKIMLSTATSQVPWTDPKPSYVFDYADGNYIGANIGMFEKIGVIGDSYASGQIYLTSTPVNYYNLSWGQVLARRIGASCINFSRGGLTTKTWLSDTERGLLFLQTSDAQGLYIVALGINDYTEINANRYALGTESDFDLANYQTTPDTFYGNLCKIIGYILEKSPNCRIILSTMALNNNTLRKSINSAIVRCAELANIACIKQYEDKYFNSNYYVNGMLYGHPTAPSYSGMATAIERLCNKCMEDNYDYFSTFVWG